MSRKTVFCRIDEGYIEICRNPEECSFGEECKNFGADSESLSKRKDDIWDQLKETFGCNSDIIAELCEIERELTKRETG